ncbi:hypothetical protein [Aquincola tertiaricarbonis]|uniref:hypothetical protein n=1 Tax=Aquincola tertiaricarbonis TaxID=391953 RepID=UPI0012ECE73F|nr:hypothetical protein [Aquincola tertiaricarbonis]
MEPITRRVHLHLHARSGIPSGQLKFFSFNMPITAAITELFSEYHSQPFAVMREIGLQARLHAMLRECLLQETCRVQVRAGRANHLTTMLTERIQMEVRVTDNEGIGPKKSDIVILRSTSEATADPITATRYPNGVFDIVSKLCVADTSAVIEVKAACSADLAERHKFRLDLSKLLELAEACPQCTACPELHFVLVDKSVGLGGQRYGAQPLAHRMPVRDWHCEDQEFIAKQTPRSQKLFWEDSPRLQLLDAPPGDSQPYVHVWELVHVDGVATDSTPLHRWAVRI